MPARGQKAWQQCQGRAAASLRQRARRPVRGLYVCSVAPNTPSKAAAQQADCARDKTASSERPLSCSADSRHTPESRAGRPKPAESRVWRGVETAHTRRAAQLRCICCQRPNPAERLGLATMGRTAGNEEAARTRQGSIATCSCAASARPRHPPRAARRNASGRALLKAARSHHPIIMAGRHQALQSRSEAPSTQVIMRASGP